MAGDGAGDGAGGAPPQEDGTGEDRKERVDRELIELLNELRVALPGVQVLFAFLLILPFNQGFSKVTDVQRDVYFAAFLCTAAASALLIAPSAYHRLNFRAANKERMLFSSNRMAIAGTAFMAVGIALVVFLIADVLFRVRVASIVTAAATAWFGWFWYALPLWVRQQRLRLERGRTGAPTG